MTRQEAILWLEDRTRFSSAELSFGLSSGTHCNKGETIDQYYGASIHNRESRECVAMSVLKTTRQAAVNEAFRVWVNS